MAGSTAAAAGLTAAVSTITVEAAIGTGLLAAPFPSHPGLVRPDWIDHNGHLNLAYYVVLMDAATDAVWNAVGLGAAYQSATGCGTFAVETHTMYVAELREGDSTEARSFLLDVDAKRLHVAHELLKAGDGAVAARQELIYLNVDLTTRRVVPWRAETLATLQAACHAHAHLRPGWVGRCCVMPGPRPG